MVKDFPVAVIFLWVFRCLTAVSFFGVSVGCRKRFRSEDPVLAPSYSILKLGRVYPIYDIAPLLKKKKEKEKNKQTNKQNNSDI